ncbi:MAG TPA: phosphotransferase [Pseudonocardiaceae bacterium]|nr:phosphotransferase [Pseudonocardiaceae bacterium]
MTRRTWDELPPAVRAAIEQQTGPVLAADIPNAGRNSDFSATLRVHGDVLFCKGISDAEGKRGQMHRHERDVNRYLPSAVAPRLRWSTETAGWLLLGFDKLPGRHADLSPGSPDLPLVADTVTTMARELAHTTAAAPLLAEQWARLAAWRRLATHRADLDEWARGQVDVLIEWERLAIELVNGESLVHTDLHSLNIVAGDGRAHVVDWAWSRLGNPAIDVAFLVNRLIAAGHTPNAAELWADTVPVWRATPENARTAFSVAILGIWEHVQRHNGLPPGAGLTAAARRWAQHRLDSRTSQTEATHSRAWTPN